MIARPLFLGFALIVSAVALSQTNSAPYRAVIDVTSPDTMVHHMVARWLKGITDTYPDAQVEVVFYAGALDMVTRERSVVEEQLSSYAADGKVGLVVCEGTMKRKQLGKDRLVEGVRITPDGLYQIIQRQHEGWAYIKAGL